MKHEHIRKLQLRLLLAWGCVVLLHFLLGSCTIEEVEEDTPKVSTETDATFFLNPPVMQNLVFTENEPTKAEEESLVADEAPRTAGDSIGTKAPGALTDEEEKRLRTLWVGQFASDGALLFSHYYGEETDKDVANELALRLKITTSPCTIYFVANTDKIRNFAGDKAAFEALTLEHSTTDDGFPIPRRCVMLGSWTGPVGRGGVTGEVTMKRVFAKITLTYSFEGTGFSFDLERIKLRNVPKTYQLFEPEGQLPDVPASYREYWDNGSNINGTIYWYLPENKAGSASGENAVQSVRDKIGTGVNRAICIDILGTAKQGNVTYKDVCFRLYPGGISPNDNNMNNYTVARNSHYTIKLRLVGIDLSDKRVTVGDIPAITNPDYMTPEKGSTKSVQITARPGQSWTMQLPAWLSATISGKLFPAGGNMTYEGPALVEFKAATANPDAKNRTHAFTLQIPDAKTFSIGQNPSSMNVRLSTDVTQNLSPIATTGTCFVTATAGLPFTGTIRHDGATWVTLTGNYKNQVATGTEQTFGYSITPNPSGTDWRGTAIQVQAGNIMKEIAFVQLNSALHIRGENVIGAAGVPAINSDFQTTAGLNWQLTHNMPWITLHTPTSGVVSSNDVQYIGYYVAPNPSRSQREGHFTIKVGNGIDKGDVNLQKNIKITQQGADMNVYTNAPSPLPAAAADNIGYGFVFWDVPAGLNYTVSSEVDWITVGGATTGISHSGEHHLNIQVNATNPNLTPRTGRIKTQVGDMVKFVDITQAGSMFEVFTFGGQIEHSFVIPEMGGVGESLRVVGTKGLVWTVQKTRNRDDPNNEIQAYIGTPGVQEIEATGEDQFVTFSAKAYYPDLGTGIRSGSFDVSIKGGTFSKTVSSMQLSVKNTILIDQGIVDKFKVAAAGDVKYKPFHFDGGVTGAVVGSDLNGNSVTYKVNEPYVIQIESNQSGTYVSYTSAMNHCKNIPLIYANEPKWRIPTLIELFAIWTTCKGSGVDASSSALFGAKLKAGAYNTSSIYSNAGVKGSLRSRLNMKSGVLSHPGDGSYYIRCVREINIK